MDSLPAEPQGKPYNPWNSPGHNTGVGSCFLLQGIFPTQGSNPGLPHCRRILYQLSHKGGPLLTQVCIKHIQGLNAKEEKLIFILFWSLEHLLCKAELWSRSQASLILYGAGHHRAMRCSEKYKTGLLNMLMIRGKNATCTLNIKREGWNIFLQQSQVRNGFLPISFGIVWCIFTNHFGLMITFWGFLLCSVLFSSYWTQSISITVSTDDGNGSKEDMSILAWSHHCVVTNTLDLLCSKPVTRDAGSSR